LDVSPGEKMDEAKAHRSTVLVQSIGSRDCMIAGLSNQQPHEPDADVQRCSAKTLEPVDLIQIELDDPPKKRILEDLGWDRWKLPFRPSFRELWIFDRIVGDRTVFGIIDARHPAELAGPRQEHGSRVPAEALGLRLIAIGR
jgi:hypothetical protein